MLKRRSMLLRSPRAPESAPALFERLEHRWTPTSAMGPEFLINATTSNTQATDSVGAIAADGAGNFVAVWESYNQDALLSWGVYGRRYDAAGVAQGTEFPVNATTANDQRAPAVAMNASGAFVVAWEGRGLLGALFPGIYVQRYNSSGVAQGTEIGVEGSLILTVNNAAIAMAPDGSFVVAWEDASVSGRDISARRYNSSGTALGAGFTVNQTTAGTQSRPQIAMDSSGNFLVVWSGNGSGDGAGVFARLYDSSGTAQTGEVLINQTTAGTQTLPAVAADSGGEFIVAWSGQGAGDSGGVFIRRVDASGAVVGSEVLVNQTTTNAQQQPSVAFDADDEYVVAWSGEGSGDADGVFGREFWGGNTAKGSEFLISSTTSGTQANVSVAGRGGNAYAFTWDGNGSGDADGVFGRLFANSIPTVSVSGGSASYTENGSGTAVDSGITVSDTDSAALIGATVRISGNYLSSEDALSFTDQLGITGSWSAGTGTLTLTGTATVASYQTALRAVLYANSSNNPSTLARTIEFIVDDGTDPSAAATRGLTVAAVNDPPVVITSGGSASYTENGAGIAVDSGLTTSDADSATLVGATIRITTNYLSSEDVLSFTNQLGITGAWDSGTGTLTLSGTTTLANYQAALRAVLYSNSSNNPSTLGRTIEFIVDDGTDPSAAATRGVSVTAVNDPPAVTTSGGSASYTENGAAVAIDSGLTLADVDSATLVGATVRISVNFLLSEDVLSFTDQLGITGSWASGTGTLTLSGTASLASYQAALRAVLYSNSSNNPSTLARSVEFIVNDGTDPSAAATRGVTVTAVNDPPVVTTSGGSASYTENASGVAVDSGLTLSDADSATFVGATVRISGNYLSSEDLLSFTDQLGITGSWDSGTGTLTLSGTTTLANYQAALRAVLYSNTSNNPSTLSRTIEFIVDDGTDPSAAATRGVTVTAVNDPPVVTTSGGSASYTENSAGVAVDSGLTLADVDSTSLVGATVRISSNYLTSEDALSFTDQLGITGSWDSGTGTLTLSGIASLADYQAALRAVLYANSSNNPSTLTRTIEFIVDDGTDPSAAATRGITVTAVNDPPVVTTSGGSASYTENSAGTAVDPGLVVSDLDSGSLVGATVRISGNYAASEDSLLFTDQLGITGAWDSGTGTLTLSGTASLANYQAALRAVSYLNSSNAPSTLARTVEFIVGDGTDPSTGSSRTVTVTAVNDPPVVTTSGGSASYSENSAAVAIDSGLTLADLDSATFVGATVRISSNFLASEDVLSFTDQLGITGSWDSGTGTLTLSGVASLANYQVALRAVLYSNSSNNPSTLTRTLEFIGDDGTDPSAPGTRGLTVTAVNDPPVVTTSGGSASYTENGAGVALDAGLSLGDVDSTTLIGATVRISTNYFSAQDVLSFIDQFGITGSWNAGTGILTLTGTAGLATYQTALRTVLYSNSSNNPSTLARMVEFIVNDGNDPSVAAGRGVSVTATNDPPVVTTSGGAAPYTENGTAAVIDSGLTVFDIDSVTLISATVRISGNFASPEDALLFTDQLGITGAWNPGTGVLTLSGTVSSADYQTALRSVRYINTSDNPSTPARTIEFILDDGTDPSPAATRGVTVAAVNDPPVVTTSGGTASYTENGAGVAADSGLTLADVDSTTLVGATVRISSNYSSTEDVLAFVNQLGITGSWNSGTGTLTLSGTVSVADYQAALRTVTYTNSSNTPSTATRTVEFIVDDGSDPSAAGSRGITVTAVNDPPVVTASGGSASYTENGSGVGVDSGLTLSDADSVNFASATVRISANYLATEDALSFTNQLGITGSWNSSTGTLTLTGSATVTDYQAALRSVLYSNSSNDPSTLNRSVEFIVDDGTDLSPAAVRGLAITAVNDAPVATTSGGAAAYTENGTGVAVDSGLTLVDVDSTVLSGATVRISASYLMSEDTLLFTDQLGITGFWNADTATLTLSGAAALSDYQTALRTVRYANFSDNPLTASRTVEFIVDDGVDPSVAETRQVVITPANDSPLVTTSGGSAAYTENGVGIAADSGLTLADVDSSNLTGATVRISTSFLSNEDALFFADQLGIAGSWDSGTGTLTLSGIASVANYQAALRSVRYANSSDNPFPLARTVEFIVDDGTDPSPAATRQVSITAVNDAPVVTASGGSGSFIEGGAPVPVDAGIALSDADSATLAGATVRISGNFAASEDVLLFTDQLGITGSWDAGTGVLTLSGIAPLASYQAALRAVRYTNFSADPSVLARAIEFMVNDGADPSFGSLRAITVSAVNQAPMIATSGGGAAYTENQPGIAVDPGLTLSDVDDATLVGATIRISAGYRPLEDVLVFADQLGISGSWDGGTGALTLSGVASLTEYETALRSILFVNTSDNPGVADRTIEFIVDDGSDASAAAARQTSVTAVNDAPTIAPSNPTVVYTEHGAPVAVDFALVLSDLDSGTLTGAVVRIIGNYTASEDLLLFADQSGISGLWDAATGMLTLSGTASIASYEAALRSIEYFNTSDTPFGAPRTVEFVVDDGADSSNPITGAVFVAGIDLPETPPSPTPDIPVATPEPDAPTPRPTIVIAPASPPSPRTPPTRATPTSVATPRPSKPAPTKPTAAKPEKPQPVADAEPAPEATAPPANPDPPPTTVATAPPAEAPPTSEPSPAAPTPAVPAPIPMPAAELAAVNIPVPVVTMAFNPPQVRRAVTRGMTYEHAVVAGSALGVGATVGLQVKKYLSAHLLQAHLFMALPMWRWFDPIPVLDSFETASRQRQRRIERAVSDVCEDEARVEEMLTERADGGPA